MRSGNVRVKDDPKNREALKIVAEWLAFTLCQPPYNGEQPPAGDRTPIGVGSGPSTYMMGEAKSLSNIYAGTTGKPGQEQIEFADEFGKAIAAAAGVVLKESARPIERINAVRLMSRRRRDAGPVRWPIRSSPSSTTRRRPRPRSSTPSRGCTTCSSSRTWPTPTGTCGVGRPATRSCTRSSPP